MKKKIVILLLASFLLLTGCRQSNVASRNVSKEADNFGITRRITVINARTDTVVFQLEGVFSIDNNFSNELTIVCKTDEGYKKHFVYLNSNTLYFVEDLSGADVSSLAYEVAFYPQKIGNVVDVDIEWVE